MQGSLAIVGLGPGKREYMTARALKAVAAADYVLGHSTYLEPLEPLLAGKNVICQFHGKGGGPGKAGNRSGPQPCCCHCIGRRCGGLRYGKYRA